jgi:hypothetical protein
MSNFDDLRALWKQQPTQLPEVDMTELKKKASRFQRLVWLRNITEWVAAALVVFFFSRMTLSDKLHWVSRVGGATIVIAAIYVAYRLYRDGRVRSLPDPALDTGLYIEEYREQLFGQAKLIRDVPYWYLGPLLPGFILIYLGYVLKDPGQWPIHAVLFTGSMLFFLWVAWINRRGAEKLERRAEKL